MLAATCNNYSQCLGWNKVGNCNQWLPHMQGCTRGADGRALREGCRHIQVRHCGMVVDCPTHMRQATKYVFALTLTPFAWSLQFWRAALGGGCAIGLLFCWSRAVLLQCGWHAVQLAQRAGLRSAPLCQACEQPSSAVPLLACRCSSGSDLFLFPLPMLQIITGEQPVRGNLRMPRVPEEATQVRRPLRLLDGVQYGDATAVGGANMY